MKRNIEKLLEEGSSQDVCTKYFGQALEQSAKITSLLTKYKNSVESKGLHYYSSYDIKSYARQLEDIADTLVRLQESAEKMNKPAYESEETDKPVLNETVEKYKSILSKIKNG